MTRDTDSVAGAFIAGGLLAMIIGGFAINAQLGDRGSGGWLVLGWWIASLGWATFLAGMIGVAVRGVADREDQPAGDGSPRTTDEIDARLRELDTQRQVGLLTDEQYFTARQDILDEQ